MNNLRNLLDRQSNYRKYLRDLEEEYNNSDLPKGRNYIKRKSYYEEVLDKTAHLITTYGNGEITKVTLMDSFMIRHTVFLTIPKEEINLYIEINFLNYTLLEKQTIQTGKPIVFKG
jgi:hypothetical protein